MITQSAPWPTRPRSRRSRASAAGFNSERNALLVDISSRNAVRAPRPSRGSWSRRPSACPRSCRGAAAITRAACARTLGSCARVDASNTTCTRAHARPRACRSNGHTRGLVARRPQRDAARRVDEPRARRRGGRRTCTRWRSGKVALRNNGTTPRASSDGSSSDAARGVRRRAGRDAHRHRARLLRAARQARGRASRSCARASDRRGPAGARTRPRARPHAARRSATSRSAAVTSESRARHRDRAVRHALQQPGAWRSRPTSSCACSSSRRPPRRSVPAPVRRGHARRDDRGRVRGARPAADAAADCRLQGGLSRRPARPLHAACRTGATPGSPRWPSRSPCAATRPCACPNCSTSSAREERANDEAAHL